LNNGVPRRSARWFDSTGGSEEFEMFIQEIISEAIDSGCKVIIVARDGEAEMELAPTGMSNVYRLGASLFTESETEGAKMLVRVHAEKGKP